MATKFQTGNNVLLSNNGRTIYVKPNSNTKCDSPRTHGKWYFEFNIDKKGVAIIIGMGDSTTRKEYPGCSTYSFGYHISDRSLYINSVYTLGIGQSYTTGDNLGIGIDMDNNIVTYFKNGVKNFHYNVGKVPTELYIEVGAGGDADTIVSLLSSAKEMKYYNLVQDTYNPWDEHRSYLIKQNGQYYSLKPSLYNLGQAKDNIELEKWYKENGINDINGIIKIKNNKSADLKLYKNNIYKTAIPINLNAITNKIEYINEDNKKEIKYNTEEYQLLDLIKKKIGNKFQIGKWEEK